ncbi:MAG: thioredoxin domain-containing protein [Bacteroidota bacterium]|nr:thioredoxin domain-containing protein [Bacteroidota bacterium]
MKINQLISVIAFVSMAFSCQSQNADVLDPTTFDQLAASTANSVILDVRTPNEYAEGFINNSINIDYNSGSFKADVRKLDKSKPTFVYCLSGGRSSSAASFMRSSGFVKVYELKGGLLSWQKNNLPIVTKNQKVSTDKISTDQYNQFTRQSPKVLIDFYAPWCAPCKKMEPDLDALAKKFEGKLSVIRINIDENKELAKSMGIDEIPVVKIYNDSKLFRTYTGYLTKESLENAVLSK